MLDLSHVAAYLLINGPVEENAPQLLSQLFWHFIEVVAANKLAAKLIATAVVHGNIAKGLHL